MMASAQVVETSVNTNNSPSQDYTTNLDDHSNHNIDSPWFKPFTVIQINQQIPEKQLGWPISQQLPKLKNWFAISEQIEFEIPWGEFYKTLLG